MAPRSTGPRSTPPRRTMRSAPDTATCAWWRASRSCIGRSSWREEERRRSPTSRTVRALPDPATWGHLSIASRLASGAFGQIYRAHDPQLNRPVALKLLRSDITLLRPVDRLLGEARTLAQVRHPNVVIVHGADVRDGRAGLWMELVDGQTLEAWLAHTRSDGRRRSDGDRDRSVSGARGRARLRDSCTVTSKHRT